MSKQATLFEGKSGFPGCVVSVEDFTPDRARSILANNDGNRKLRPGVAEAYGLDMEGGSWNHCAAPIVFYADGKLADGQHRMEAIVLSGTTQRFIVVRGFKRSDGLTIDRGLARTLVDNARISGLDIHLSNQLLSVARGVEEGNSSGAVGRSRSLTDAERIAMVASHREACEWAIAHNPGGRITNNSVVKVAVARAWYVEANKERLAQFCEVLRTGQSSGKADSAAVSIRNYLINMHQRKMLTSAANTWRDTFLKVQNAIHYFMRESPLTVIKGVQDEWYPLGGKRVAVTGRGQQRERAAQHRAEAR